MADTDNIWAIDTTMIIRYPPEVDVEAIVKAHGGNVNALRHLPDSSVVLGARPTAIRRATPEEIDTAEVVP